MDNILIDSIREVQARKMFEILHDNKIGPSEDQWDYVDDLTKENLANVWNQTRSSQ